MTHTPGPWGRNIPPASKYNTIYAGRNTHVAHLHRDGLTPEEIEANANLIAAAPELLAALEALLEHESEDLDVPVSEMIGGVWGIARNAINKARGV